MAQPCVTCTHENRSAIEAMIAGGAGLSAVERKFHVTRDALRRHRDRHMSASLAAIHEAVSRKVQREVANAATARDRVEGLVAKLEALVERTDSERRESMLLGASRELRASIELLARLSGELRPENQRRSDPQPQHLRRVGPNRQAILAALQRHPDALADVTEALRLLGMEAGRERTSWPATCCAPSIPSRSARRSAWSRTTGRSGRCAAGIRGNSGTAAASPASQRLPLWLPSTRPTPCRTRWS